MTNEAASSPLRLSPFEQLRLAREILRAEAKTVLALADRLTSEFCDAVQLLRGCRGSVLVSGMGKAGLIGQKIAATLASTGTRSHFLHPAEAVHGDLGRVHRDDIVLMLSFSGETEEVVNILPSLRDLETPIIAITGRPTSTLAQFAAVTLELGPIDEACSLGLAPSSSTTAMLALGDALALVVSRERNFRAEDFGRNHPGGSLGRKLAKVDDVMRPLPDCRVALESKTVREVFIELRRPDRRSGAILVVDSAGALTGIFTDSDLARLFESKRDEAIDGPLRGVMTAAPKTVLAGSRMPVALEILKDKKISELPVVDSAGKPVGLIDITDVIGAVSESRASSPSSKSATAHAEPAGSTAHVQPATLPFRNKKKPHEPNPQPET